MKLNSIKYRSIIHSERRYTPRNRTISGQQVFPALKEISTLEEIKKKKTETVEFNCLSKTAKLRKKV